jgi:predicted PhzF superfamily epimerase YddE/YHI9
MPWIRQREKCSCRYFVDSVDVLEDLAGGNTTGKSIGVTRAQGMVAVDHRSSGMATHRPR